MEKRSPKPWPDGGGSRSPPLLARKAAAGRGAELGSHSRPPHGPRPAPAAALPHFSRAASALQGALHGKGLCRRAGSGRSVAAPGSPDVQGKGSAQHPST